MSEDSKSRDEAFIAQLGEKLNEARRLGVYDQAIKIIEQVIEISELSEAARSKLGTTSEECH